MNNRRWLYRRLDAGNHCVDGDAPAGRLSLNHFLGISSIAVTGGTGTATHEARLLINGVVVDSIAAQTTVVVGEPGDAQNFTGLFDAVRDVPAGTVTVAVELRRATGTGTITLMNNRLDILVVAS